jgi:hypothetical protein
VQFWSDAISTCLEPRRMLWLKIRGFASRPTAETLS